MAKTGSSQNQEQSIIIKQENESVEYSVPAPPQPRQAGTSLLKTASTQVSTTKPQQPVQMQRTTQSQQQVSSSTVSAVTRQPPQRQAQPQPQQKPQPPAQVAPAATASTGTQIVTQKIPMTTNPTPRRIDSKTMHSLIAMGAENTTGPWLCLRCGVNGRPISIPSYRGFRRHLVNTHREKIDRRLCEHCGWRSGNDKELHHHLRVQHDILPPRGYDFPACSLCPSIFLDHAGHEQHLKEEHPDKVQYQQQCMYCDGLFKDEEELYNHMQSLHKAQAQNDGLIDYTDEEDNAYFSSEPAPQTSENKIKILSSITISPKSAVKAPTGKLGAEALSSVATGIAASLGLIDSTDSQEVQYLDEGDFIAGASTSSAEPKFVNADGQLMELTAEQRDEIMSQLQNQPEGGVVMVLNDSFNGTSDGAVIKQEEASSKDEEMVDEALLAEYDSGSGKKEPVSDWQNEFKNSMKSKDKEESAAATDESEKAAEPASEEDDTTNNDPLKDSDDDQDDQDDEADDSKKDEDETEKIEKAKENLKMLTGDWSDDEEEETAPTTSDEKAPPAKEEDDASSPQPDSAPKEEEPEDAETGQIIFETFTTSNKDTEDDLDNSLGMLHAEEPETESEATSTVKDEQTSEAKPEESVAESTVTESSEAAPHEEECAAEAEETSTADKEPDEQPPEPESADESNEKDKNKDINSDGDDEQPIEEEKSAEEKEESANAAAAEEKEKAETDADEMKEEPSGEHIRTLISEWGDEDEEED